MILLHLAKKVFIHYNKHTFIEADINIRSADSKMIHLIENNDKLNSFCFSLNQTA